MSVEIIETGKIPTNPIVVEGFPSVGLVGSIATEFLATKLNMEEIGFFKSSHLPPVAIVKESIPKATIRIFFKNNLVVIVSDTAVPPNLIHEIASAIVAWAKKIGAQKIISLGGIAKAEGEASKDIFIVSNQPEKIKNSKFKTIQVGFLTGVFGALMLECLESKIPAYGFLSKAEPNSPDPTAAALVLDALSSDLNLNLDTSTLSAASAKMERKMKELLDETKKAMNSTSYPSIYG